MAWVPDLERTGGDEAQPYVNRFYQFAEPLEKQLDDRI